MKKIALFASVLLALVFYSHSFAEMKIGVIDVNRVLTNVQQIKDMQADLKKQFDPRGEEIVKLQNIFRDEIDKYKQNNTTMKGEILKTEQQKLIDENKKLQEARIGFQRDLVAAQNQALRPILKQIESIVNKIAQDQNFDLIVTRVSTAYDNPKLEITDQVISEMGKLIPDTSKVKKGKKSNRQ